MKRSCSERNYNIKRGWHGGNNIESIMSSFWFQQRSSNHITTALIISSLFLLVGLVAFLTTCFDSPIFSGIITPTKPIVAANEPPPIPKQEFPLNCTTWNQSCPAHYYPTNYTSINLDRPSNSTCPSYFQWIHEDLRPWKETGITKDMIDRSPADFKLVIVNGRAYLKKFRSSFQTRDMFTWWGILQLLRFYPGRLPDLELMFGCGDRPLVRTGDFQGPNATTPPPLFSYCRDDYTMDILFPDWTFWGWAEVNIKPWTNILKDITEGSRKIEWTNRLPYAYWKGNPNTNRKDLMKCNVDNKNDWETRLFVQDWKKETRGGFKHSRLEDQCTYRYKIYIEGWGWSVSEKYILACDSMSLFVKSHFYDFYTRGLMPLQHYWPIRASNKCPSLKFAVEWGNNHTQQAQAIGKAAVKFLEEDLKMEYVYDYMLHLLTEYSKLLKFKPSVPEDAVELCAESMACPANGPWRTFMEESMVVSPSEMGPCTMMPPMGPEALQEIMKMKASITREVELWEDEYWHHR